MLKLTDRLQSIADEIEQGETMADIGTDHGFLPIYLFEKGISPKVIMADISEPSLNKSRQYVNEFLNDKKVLFRLGSGLKVIEKGEVESIVMAGMGGILMTEILEDDMEKTLSYKKFVFQPRSHIGVLRYWLLKNGFYIFNEKLIREGDKICPIITAKKGERCFDRRTDSWDIEYEFPLSLIKFKSPLLKEYIHVNYQKEIFKLKSMKKAKKQNFINLRRQKHRVEYLEYFMREINEGL